MISKQKLLILRHEELCKMIGYNINIREISSILDITISNIDRLLMRPEIQKRVLFYEKEAKSLRGASINELE